MMTLPPPRYDARRLFKCSVCGKPCELGCGCVAKIIRSYLDNDRCRSAAVCGPACVDANGAPVEAE